MRIRHRNTLANNGHNDYAVALIDGMTVDKFQITFRAKYINAYARPMLRFAYQGDDSFFQVGVKGDGKYIYIDYVENDEGESKTLGIGDIADSDELPGISTGNKAWFRYESDGSTITGYCIEQDNAPTEGEWAGKNPFLKYTGIDNNGRGGIGLGTRGEGGIEFEDVILKSDPDGDGTYDIVELHEFFESDSNGFVDMEPEHDAAGNLTYDGLRKYTYDAFNRLVKVQNAFKDPGYTPSGGSAGDLAVGSTIAEYAYDAQNRRIRKDTYIGGELDNVEHFYCIGDTLVETRNGSNQVIQQHVWHSLARDYIDSLAEVSNNTNPGVDDSCDERLFTLQDTQFNVLALTDADGDVVERYEYDLYGQRTVMNKTFVVLHHSAYNINCGFQGLYHDTETGLIYNRARMLNSRLKRFNQRDPLGYPDGMNSYAAYHVMHGGVDPWGMSWVDNDYTNTRQGMTRKSVTIDTPLSGRKKYGYEPANDSTAQSAGWYETREVSTHSEIRDHLERQADALGTTVSEQAYRELVQALYNSKSGKLDLLDYACGNKSQEMEHMKLAAQGWLELIEGWGESGGMDIETAHGIEQDIQEGNLGKAAAVILASAAGKAILDKVGGKFLGNLFRRAKKCSIGDKVKDQMNKRGWTPKSIDDAVNRPSRTVGTRDRRHLADGGRMDDPATAYFAEDGSYIVRNDVTGDIVQISDKTDPDWIVPWD